MMLINADGSLITTDGDAHMDSVDVGTMKNKPTDNIQDDDDDIDDADDYCYRNRMTMVRLCRPFDD